MLIPPWWLRTSFEKLIPKFLTPVNPNSTLSQHEHLACELNHWCHTLSLRPYKWHALRTLALSMSPFSPWHFDRSFSKSDVRRDTSWVKSSRTCRSSSSSSRSSFLSFTKIIYWEMSIQISIKLRLGTYTIIHLFNLMSFILIGLFVSSYLHVY